MELFVLMRMFLGIQVFQNDDKSCPERHGGANQTSLYIDSSEPSPGGGGMWKPDNTIRRVRSFFFVYKIIAFPCREYEAKCSYLI